MKLKTINRWLKKAGLVLVVQTGDADEPIELTLERYSQYHKRVIRSSNPEINGCLLLRPLLDDECECGALVDIHEMGVEGCEYRGRPTVDEGAGEWRCMCPPHPTFDTSINPKWVKVCGKCGGDRPGG